MNHGQISLGGIPHRISVHEGLVSFADDSGLHSGSIAITKCEPHGLLYADVSSYYGRVPVCHIEKASRIAAHFLGPNHFLSHSDRHRFERNNAAKNLFRYWHWRLRKFYGFRWRMRLIGWVIGHQWRLWFPEPAPLIRWYEPPQKQKQLVEV